MSSEVLLEAEDLVRTFGTFRAVDGLNLQVHAGEMVGLVGPDGAGKTTAIRLMCGALSPDSGKVRVAGYEIPAQVEKAREQIGYLAQRFSLYGDLSVQENIEFFGEVFEVPEDRYGEIHIGQEATVTVDSFPGQTFKATVTKIADQAEFTPRNVQTVEGRSATVYAVKLKVNDPEGKLKLGMPADVVFVQSNG